MADSLGTVDVSAIIIVFNGARYLSEAIESVLGQTFGSWELIVVDDGSSDDSAAIARRYAAADPDRIEVVAHPDGGNHGMAATRNCGLAVARGRYVAFLDADDVWLPEKLAEQVAILERHPACDLVYGRSLIWYSWDAATDTGDFFYPLGVSADASYSPPVLFKLLLANKAQTPTPCNVMLRAELVARIGGFDARFRGMFEDLTLFAPALAYATAYVSGRTWAKYRQHRESCTALSAGAGRDEWLRLAFLFWLCRRMANAPISINRLVWVALARMGLTLFKRPMRRALERG